MYLTDNIEDSFQCIKLFIVKIQWFGQAEQDVIPPESTGFRTRVEIGIACYKTGARSQPPAECLEKVLARPLETSTKEAVH